MDYAEALELVKGAIFTDRQPCDECVKRAIMCLEGRGGTDMTTDEAVHEVRFRLRQIRATAHEHATFMGAMEDIYCETVARKSV